MQTIQATYSAAPLPPAAFGQDSIEIQALPWGTVDLVDKKQREAFGEPGVLHVDQTSATKIPTAFAGRSIDYYVNEQHRHGQALGWISNVNVKPGKGVFVDVDLTSSGQEMVSGGVYRYFSSEVQLKVSEDWKDAWPVAIVGGALTNDPAIRGMKPVTLSVHPAGDSPGVEPDSYKARAAQAELIKLIAKRKGISFADAYVEYHKAEQHRPQVHEPGPSVEDAAIARALVEGWIVPNQAAWAKANFEAFLMLASAKRGR